MTNDIKRRDQAINSYIHSRDEEDKLQNLFFELIGQTGSNEVDLKFNLVTTLLNNGFKSDDEVKRWYFAQLKIRKE